jgi:hypothetical protein
MQPDNDDDEDLDRQNTAAMKGKHLLVSATTPPEELGGISFAETPREIFTISLLSGHGTSFDKLQDRTCAWNPHLFFARLITIFPPGWGGHPKIYSYGVYG